MLASPATPDKIARHGHTAAALRAYFKRTGESIGDFNIKMGMNRGSANIYQWMNCKLGMSRKMARKVSKITGIPVEDLTPRALNTKVESKALVVIKDPIRREVLSFAVLQDGEARIKLDISLPLKSATPLLRLLLDAGLVLS
jgi:hypothetical protein